MRINNGEKFLIKQSESGKSVFLGQVCATCFKSFPKPYGYPEYCSDCDDKAIKKFLRSNSMGRTIKTAGKYRLVDTRMDFQTKSDFQILEKFGDKPNEWKCLSYHLKIEGALEAFDDLLKVSKPTPLATLHAQE